MKTRFVIKIALASVIGVGILFLLTYRINPISQKVNSTMSQSEYEAYKTILRLYPLVALYEQTRVDELFEQTRVDELFEYEEIKTKMPKLQKITWLDFISKNQLSILFDENDAKNLEIPLITQNEFKEIFENNFSNGWKIFYEKYPNLHGIITFSRIGFNKERNQALVYVTYTSDYLSGDGICFLLIKKKILWKSFWVIKKKVLIWIA